MTSDISYIRNFLQQKGVINSKFMRKFCWEKYFDNECQDVFNKFSSNYRSHEEAWFCLAYNVNPPICQVCNNKLAVFTGNRKSIIKGYNTVCENCSANNSPIKLQKYHNTCLTRTNKPYYKTPRKMLYGSPEFKQAMLKKYGVEDPSVLPEAKTKRANTNLSRYNVKCVLELDKERSKRIWDNKHDEILLKRTNTCIQKYNVNNYIETEEFKIKAINTKRNKISQYESDNDVVLYSKVIKLFGQGWIRHADELGIDFVFHDNHKYVKLSQLNNIKNYTSVGTRTNSYVSNKEIELRNFISSIYDGVILHNVTNVIKNNNNRYYEVDIYLPELNICIDFDGSYYHSTIFKRKNYHHNKTKCSYEQGYKFVHIYEYDWDLNQESIKHELNKLILNGINEALNCIDIKDYNTRYKLSKPELITLTNKRGEISMKIYNEGKFVKI